MMDLGLLKQLIVIKRKDYLTLAAASCGLLAIYSTMMGYTASWLLILAAVVFDYLDGMISRMGKKPATNDFGRELDSLADAVAFGTAPAAIAMSARPDAVGFIAALFYMCCALVRLGLFNLQKEKNYYGLPTPAAALAAAAVLAVYPTEVSVPVTMVALGVLMVSGFRIVKPQL